MAGTHAVRRPTKSNSARNTHGSFDHRRELLGGSEPAPLPLPDELWDPDELDDEPLPGHGDFWLETDDDED